MKIDNRWMFLLAVTASAAAGAAIASRAFRHQARAAGESQHSTNLKTWENEGGNLAPPPASAAATLSTALNAPVHRPG